MSSLDLFFATASLAAALTLQTPSGELHGTEVVPVQPGPHPVVLIIAGSGPTDRDGNNRMLPGRNDALKMLAEGLAKEGVASVRYDKRGIGASAQAAAAEQDLRFEHLIDDAAAWVEKLRTDRRFARVSLAGHSEGSLVGMLAARQAKADAFVSIAGIARRADAVLREQLKGKLPPELSAESERILLALVAGKTVDDPRPELAALYRPSVQPYLVSWLRHTPSEILAALPMPVLILQGTHDIQVSVGEAQALASAKPGARLVLVEGMNHVLKKTPADAAQQIASYGDPDLPIVGTVVTEVARLARGP